MVFKRSITKYLSEWKNGSNRKPLIIRGARQVGKTTVIKEFAKTYKQSVFLNLEKKLDKYHFENLPEVKEVLESLFLANNISIEQISDTLLFIDEIQESTKAIEMLRYFYEDFPMLHVIAAGSLLEFSFKEIKSFPVARVEYLYLHPMNFAEFLEACDNTQAVDHFNIIPVSKMSHHYLIQAFNKYAIIGGMPEAVRDYLEKQSFTNLPKIYESIWSTYKNDVEKYATNSTERKVIKHVMDTAPTELDKRVKFQQFGNSNYKSREVGEAIRKLDDAKIIRLIYPTTETSIPVKADYKKSPRLQFLDTGLVNHALGISAGMIGVADLSNSYRGAIIPHLIIQEIISINAFTNNKPNFWVREKSQSSAEVDLVFAYKDKVIPIEIKSGASGTLKSLHQFVDQRKHPYAIRFYAGEFSVEKTKTPQGTPYLLMNLPYYLGTKIPEYIEYFVNNYSL
ncbi:MAG: ATP-binding protein [Bacteroidales bacterium]|nr:ATP-binding protein [Bacteroidales bacterium]